MQTFDAEPVQYEQTEMTVEARRIRRTDRFRHRTQGWVTVTDVSTGHKNTTFQYVRDSDGKPGSTYAPKDFDSPIVRQEVTDAWTLWECETKLDALVAERTSDEANAERTATLRASIRGDRAGSVATIIRALLELVEREVDDRLWLRLGSMLERGPRTHQRNTFIHGDVATTVIALVDEVTSELLYEVGQDSRRDDATLREQTILGQFARGHGRPLEYGRIVSMARDVVRLREVFDNSSRSVPE